MREPGKHFTEDLFESLSSTTPRRIGNGPVDIFPLIDKHTSWIKGERAVFWCWLFIRKADLNMLGIQKSEKSNLRPQEILYHQIPLNKNPKSHEERSTAIRFWIDLLLKEFAHEEFKRILSDMCEEWAYINDTLKSLSWLPKSELETRWAWEQIKSAEFFDSRNVCNWYHPLDANERYNAIVAAFDDVSPDEYATIGHLVKERNRLIKNLHDEFKKKKNKNRDSRVQISVKISKDVKRKLDKIVKDRRTTQQAIIEQIILNGRLD